MAPKQDNRNNGLAAIHALAKSLGIDTKDKSESSEYRSLLWTVARVRSARDLDFAGRARVIEHLRARGAGVDEWHWARSMPPEKSKMLWKLRRLCIELGIRKGSQLRYCEGVARRQLGLERVLRMMSEGELWRLIGPLENTLNHKRYSKEAAT